MSNRDNKYNNEKKILEHFGINAGQIIAIIIVSLFVIIVCYIIITSKLSLFSPFPKKIV